MQSQYGQLVESQRKEIGVLKSTVEAMERREGWMKGELADKEKREERVMAVVREMRAAIKGN